MQYFYCFTGDLRALQPTGLRKKISRWAEDQIHHWGVARGLGTSHLLWVVPQPVIHHHSPPSNHPVAAKDKYQDRQMRGHFCVPAPQIN